MPVLKNTKVLFSNVLNVDDFSGKYQVVVEVDENQAADAEAAGLIVKTKEYDGKTQFSLQFKSKFRPRIVERDGKTDATLEGEIGRGSQVNIQYKFRDWVGRTGGNKGVAQDLNAIQVMDLKGNGASEFEDEGDSFGAEEY